MIVVAIVIIAVAMPFEKTKGTKISMGEPVKVEDSEILILGDSIFGMLKNFSRIDNLLHHKVGAKAYNMAIGGTSAAKSKSHYELTRKLSLLPLTDAIKNDSFAYLEKDMDEIVKESIPYYGQIVQGLKEIEYENIDYVIINYGTNDYMLSAPIEDKWFRDSEYTYKGALRKGIETIHEACPNAIIILCTPIYCNFYYRDNLNGDSNTKSFGHGTLKNYAKAVREVAEEYGIYCIDGFNDLDINEDNWKEYLGDGIHPNWQGMRLYCDLVIEKLREIDGSSE